MNVYCKCYDCKSNNNGECEKTQPAGHEAIYIADTLFGPQCSDYEEGE